MVCSPSRNRKETAPASASSPPAMRMNGLCHGQNNDNPSADLVRVYLNGIGKTALLTAEDEVHLAQTIEVGLYAECLLTDSDEISAKAL